MGRKAEYFQGETFKVVIHNLQEWLTKNNDAKIITMAQSECFTDWGPKAEREITITIIHT